MILILASKFLFYLLLLFLGVWCSIIWKTRRIRHETSRLRHLKYKPLPFIGHLHHFLKRNLEDMTEFFFDTIRDALDKGIETACFWIGPFPLVFIWGADDIQKVLISTATNEKAEEYKYIKFVFGNGLLTAPNNYWRITRSHVNPVFHPRNVELMIPAMNRNCQELVLSLSSHLDSQPVNVFKYSLKTALKSVNQLIFGPEFPFNKISQEFDRWLHMFERIPDILIQRLFKPWLWNEYIFNYVYQKDMSEFDNTIKALIKSSLKELSQEPGKYSQQTGDGDGSNTNNSSENGISNLLEFYRNLQNKWESFTDKELMYEITTIYGAGSDSVAITVSSCLLALAQYPDVQDKLYNEIALVVNDDEITLEQIEKMQYLDQVMNETLRLYAAIPVIARKCTEDLKLSECTVPAGNTVSVMLAGLHMNPRVYPNPETFDPERFSPENASDRIKHTLLPFSRGPRSCIGKRYAELLVKLMVAHVVRHYKLSTDMNIQTIKKKWAITLVNSEGYNIKLQSRSKK